VPVSVSASATFGELMNPLSLIGNIVLRLTNTVVVVPVAHSFSSDLRTIILTPLEPLQPGTQYTIALPGYYLMRDLAGNGLVSSPTATFTTQ
jgi:hypothetical protein